jgi:3-hydroxybutyryl-CoA dehydrogenase
MKADELKKVAILGAGQMGSGIAQVMAGAGIDVILYDLAPAQLERARLGLERNIAKLAEKGKVSDPAAMLSRISFAIDLGAVVDADFLVEAVVESELEKNKLFEFLNMKMRNDVIFASNTSSVSITRMASASGRPDRFVGMHFMNPAPIMKLVEVVVGLATAEETTVFVEQLAERLGKTHVRAEDHPGFIVNRILLPMINEAIYTLQDGVGSPQDIDTAMMQGTNQPMGPLALADLIGLDTVLAIMEVMHHTFGDDKYRPAPLLRRYVDAHYLGRKRGRGFYHYGEVRGAVVPQAV